MNSKQSDPTEIEMQVKLLFTDVGILGSGHVRYAAAMYLYHQKMVSAEMLEIYRRCCKFDNQDPIDLAQMESIAAIPEPSLKS